MYAFYVVCSCAQDTILERPYMKRYFLLMSVISISILCCAKTPMQYSEFSLVLKPSPIGGVGVFATHDISAGTVLLRSGNDLRTFKIKDVPPDLIKYCIYINEHECVGPQEFDRMEIGWYINHSSTPNIGKRSKHCPEKVGNGWAVALRDIKAGEEIVMDYNELGEPENLKEDYYYKVPENL